jgi:hypothetical protein
VSTHQPCVAAGASNICAAVEWPHHAGVLMSSTLLLLLVSNLSPLTPCPCPLPCSSSPARRPAGGAAAGLQRAPPGRPGDGGGGGGRSTARGAGRHSSCSRAAGGGLQGAVRRGETLLGRGMLYMGGGWGGGQVKKAPTQVADSCSILQVDECHCGYPMHTLFVVRLQYYFCSAPRMLWSNHTMHANMSNLMSALRGVLLPFPSPPPTRHRLSAPRSCAWWPVSTTW